ncbi:hypothetical protein JMJ35_003135 [Cladonia borealis]|uniref:Prion-inhibition and propagation HeLo domain-containing protein n=1 Tax=Cladonia borealis TaxID=184061 RepID=A0AA39R448_9LECA|nr:hypothetical protein JMJ35_003135 [Cladonia borealis]
METAGLTIGAIALASLFTECIECLDLIELARSSEKGLKTQVCKLSIIKRQFMVWGESIGLLSPDEGRDDVLDQVKGRKEIEDVLQQISILLQDAEKLKTQYGIELDSTDDRQSHCIEVSRSRRDIFKQNPIVGFISRLAAHQRRSTILTKTRWAIRDSKKFEGLVKDLDWFVTKLLAIDVSLETHIRQEMATREEVESIVDLSTLTIMEQTCRGPTRSWATAARIHSEYLSSASSVVGRNQRIQDWNAHLESTGSDSQSMSVDERTRKRHGDEALSPSSSMTSLIRPDSAPIPLLKKRSMLCSPTYCD